MPFANPIVIQDDLLSVMACAKESQTECPEVVLSRFNIVSQCLANMEAATASLTSTIMSELEDIFASLDLGSSESLVRSPCAISPTEWLLDNLHNPYPPGAVRRAMEDSPELCSRTVNEWFAKARQRIGWTRLLRDRFNGCRSAATDAAFRAFVRDDPRSPLDAELCAAFMAVKAHANLVYTPSPPSTVDTTLYSLPSRSPSVAPSLTYSIDSEDSDGDASQPSRKRKRSCSEVPSDPHSVPPRPRKRRPSPSPRKTSHSLSPPHISSQDVSSPPPPSRKRRLSESNSVEPAVKKPRCSDWAPRKQTVSDPLPLPTSSFDWESWCIEAFALPPSATMGRPMPDALDFELFNFEAFPAPQPIDITGSPADTRLEFPEQPGVWVDPLFITPSQTERGPPPASWDDFFNFELPSSMPSLTNSPSSPDTLWSLPPPELSCFDSLESSLFNFSSPSLFKIPNLYPADGVEIVDINNSLIL